MKILVVNAGSSSLKYQLIDMNGEKVLAKGNCDRIGNPDGGVLEHKTGDGKKIKKELMVNDHKQAFDIVLDALINGEGKVIDSIKEIDAVGHRVVQGGSLFDRSCIVTDEVVEQIYDLAKLAPLHNKAHVTGIKACTEALGKDVPQVVVFDTAFHQTMPEKAYIFPIPYEYYEKYQIRRYGAHGTSHRYVSARCAELLGKDIKDTKIITCHLGNGCSITAVDGGKCIDTSMGLTPVDGIMMGTRSGSLDPNVLTYIAQQENLTPAELDTLCNKKSGLLGVSGVSNDSRDVNDAADAGHERSKLALDIQRYQLLKFIGSYAAVLGRVDAIVFTAGIGENDPGLRQYVCDQLTILGVKCDPVINADRSIKDEHLISTPDSKVKVFVIPTNEELVIARDTKEIVENLSK